VTPDDEPTFDGDGNCAACILVGRALVAECPFHPSTARLDERPSDSAFELLKRENERLETANASMSDEIEAMVKTEPVDAHVEHNRALYAARLALGDEILRRQRKGGKSVRLSSLAPWFDEIERLSAPEPATDAEPAAEPGASERPAGPAPAPVADAPPPREAMVTRRVPRGLPSTTERAASDVAAQTDRESVPHQISGFATVEEIAASDNRVIRENHEKSVEPAPAPPATERGPVDPVTIVQTPEDAARDLGLPAPPIVGTDTPAAERPGALQVADPTAPWLDDFPDDDDPAFG
jgi:hypothetical protein